MKTYVVNLEKSKEKYYKQKPILESVGLNVERFNAINAMQNEHLKYKTNIDKLAYFFTPKSVLGCALSHILLAKHILLNNTESPYFLIMEDDAFPIELDKARFLNSIDETINNVNLLDSNWDIIQLHSDACFPCNNTYTTHPLCGSTAAYLLSRKGANKMKEVKATSHIDVHTSVSTNFRKYRCKNNIFWTDENNSDNRIDANNITKMFFSYILTKIIPLRGEKRWDHFLNFKLLHLPLIDKDLTAIQIINYIIIYNIVKKVISISKK